MPRKRRDPPDMPSREAIRRFVLETPGRVGKREIAREFGLTAQQRPALRDLLKDMTDEGDGAPVGRRRVAAPGFLPDATIVQVTGTDPDGDAIARPVGWQGDGPPPLVLMAPEPYGRPALAPGERVLARLRPIRAEQIRRPHAETADRRTRPRARRVPLHPGRRRTHRTYRPARQGRMGGAARRGGRGQRRRNRAGDPLARLGLRTQAGARDGTSGRHGRRPLGQPDRHPHPRHPGRIPRCRTGAKPAHARGVGLHDRTDLRDIPLVTIDGEDARDFDDAVFAEPEGDGFRLLVAIADVAHYVRPDSALDRSARTRGNSCYFPDRVVPMLPEALSNGLVQPAPGGGPRLPVR